MRILASGGRHRIVLLGELDLAAAPELLAIVRDLIAARSEELEIDLRKVVFVDSAALRALVVAREECEQTGSPLYVIPSASESVRELFVLTNTHTALPWRLPITEAQRATICGLEDAYRADADDDSELRPAG